MTVSRSAKVVGQHVALERQVYSRIWTCLNNLSFPSCGANAWAVVVMSKSHGWLLSAKFGRNLGENQNGLWRRETEMKNGRQLGKSHHIWVLTVFCCLPLPRVWWRRRESNPVEKLEEVGLKRIAQRLG